MSSVPLILNTQTGLVSPQFHCVYNDGFDIVHYDKHFQSLWQVKAKLQEQEETTQDNDHLVTDKPTQKSMTLTNYARTNVPPALLDLPEQLSALTETTQAQTNNLPQQQAQQSNETSPQATTQQQPRHERQSEGAPSYPVNIAPTGTTRSGRTVRPPQWSLFAAIRSATLHPLATPVAFSGLKNTNPDTTSFEEAMRQLDADKFIKAMEHKLNEHHQLKHLKVISRVATKCQTNPHGVEYEKKTRPNG